MFTRGYIEVLFKTADTPLSRELEVARARYPGVHLAAFTVADAAAAHGRLAERGFRVRPLVHMQRPVETGGPPGNAPLTPAARGAGGNTGGAHPNPHPPHRGHGLAAALAVASERRLVARQHRDRGRRCRGSRAALRALHRPRGEALAAWPDDRARPWLRAARDHRRIREKTAGGGDPLAAVHRRLRDQGGVARGHRRHVEARRSANAPQRARLGRDLPRGTRARRLAVRGMTVGRPETRPNAHRLPILFRTHAPLAL